MYLTYTGNFRYKLFVLIIEKKNSRLRSSFSIISARTLDVSKLNFAGTIKPTSRCFLPVIVIFIWFSLYLSRN